MIPDDVAAVRRLLASLPAGEPDVARAMRVRARCRADLVHRADRAARRPFLHHRLATALTTFAEPAIVGGFCLVYLAGVIALTLRFEGIL